MMPKEGFVSVTLNINIIERLKKVIENKKLSTEVTKAIEFYLDKLNSEKPIDGKNWLEYRGLSATANTVYYFQSLYV